MHTIHNEQTKLTATWLNNLAAAFAVAGFVAPAVSGQLDGAGRFVLALIWIGIGAGLHALARKVLKGLRQ